MAKKILLAVTGASGSIYAGRLLEVLSNTEHDISVIFSESAKKVCLFELRGTAKEEAHNSILRSLLKSNKAIKTPKEITLYDNTDFFAACASGSSVPDYMILLPCSMGTLGRIVSGASGNLIERAADVVLKQRKTLIICPRESPYNLIHLENMTQLCRVGAHIVPLAPGFYHHPKTVLDVVDFMIGRILELMNIEHELYPKWG